MTSLTDLVTHVARPALHALLHRYGMGQARDELQSALQEAYELGVRAAQARRASACWHCGETLESCSRAACFDCDIDCDVEDCDAPGCAGEEAGQ